MSASFRLMARALVRGHVVTLLLAATALVHALLPSLVRGDGTAAGWREMFVRSVPGTVVAIVLVALLAVACGVFARERESHRLPLTVVRPASAFAVAAGRWLGLCALAAIVLAFNAALTFLRSSQAPDCRHHLQPVLPPPGVTAQKMMESYLSDPATPESVRKAPRHKVLALLTNKELDRYDVIPAGGKMSWPISADGLEPDRDENRRIAVRVCFASTYSTREPVRGRFFLGGAVGVVSNDTQSIWEVPLSGTISPQPLNPSTSDARELTFVNEGKDSVMLRPRRDLMLLVPADAFGFNLFRATVQSFATMALLAAFGLFLSAALSRPVAVFTALVLVAVALMAPSAVAQFPDSLDVSLANRIGLALSRGVSAITSSFAEPSPVSDLAMGRCIEWAELIRAVIVNAVILPGGLLVLAALTVRRHPMP